MKNDDRQRYQMIPRTLVFIKKSDKYLMIQKKKRESFGFNKINGVGGHIEKGEEPYESAIREIKEETNLSVANMDLIAILFIDIYSSPGIQVFIFKAEYSGGEISSSEEGGLKWMSFSEICSSSDMVFDVPDIIKICEAHKKNSEARIIKYIYDDFGKLRVVIRH